MLPNRTFASVPDSEISLGGIYFGASMQYVKSIYGTPDKKSTIYVSENNGFATPAGVIVGMDYTVP